MCFLNSPKNCKHLDNYIYKKKNHTISNINRGIMLSETKASMKEGGGETFSACQLYLSFENDKFRVKICLRLYGK